MYLLYFTTIPHNEWPSILGIDKGYNSINLITGYEPKCCRGCPRSEFTARRCLGLLKPTLNDVEGDSWEELDTAEIVHGANSLRWLVWVCISILFDALFVHCGFQLLTYVVRIRKQVTLYDRIQYTNVRYLKNRDRIKLGYVDKIISVALYTCCLLKY